MLNSKNNIDNSIHRLKKAFYLVIYIVPLGLVISFPSCKKNEESFLKDVAGQFSNYPSSSIGKANQLLIGDQVVATSTPNPPGLPVMLEQAIDDSVEVVGSIDTLLISTFNELQKTRFPIFPSTAFGIGNNGRIVLAPHLLQSLDSLQIFLRDANGLAHNTVYLIPIRLSTTSPIGKLKSSIMFLKIHITINHILGKMHIFSGGTNFSITSTWRDDYIAGTARNLKLNGVNDGPATIEFSARLAQSMPVGVEAEAGIVQDSADSSLTWFSQNIANAPLKRFPNDAFQIIQNKVSIPAGSIYSATNFSVAIDYNALAPSDTNYLLVLNIDNADDNSLIVPQRNGNGHRAFIQVSMSEVITGNVAISNDGLSGSAIDRKNWRATSSAEDPAFPATNLLDQSILTFWRGAKQGPQDLTIDMGNVYTLKGFFLTPQYTQLYDDFSNMRIYSSEDGTTWIYQGMYRGTSTNWQSSVEKPDIKTLRFLTPVTTRYVKFSFVNNNYNTPAIANINGIE